MKNKNKIDWWIYLIPFLILLAIVFYMIVQARMGIVSTVTFDSGPSIVSFFSLVIFIIGLVYAFKNKPLFSISRLIAIIVLTFLFCNGNFFGRYPSYYDDKPSIVQFRVPTDTELAVAWGGKSVKENYHAAYSQQCWAYDLLMVKDGKTHSGTGDKLTDYYCYGVDLLAPAAGKIIGAFDSDPDMPLGVIGGGTTVYGNHIIMEVAKQEYLYICHLKPNSILVEIGDTVVKGQKLALIGNSGNTDEPHIHIHLEDGLDYGEGKPMYFYDVLVDGVHQEKAIPTGGIDTDNNLVGQKIKHAGTLSSDD